MPIKSWKALQKNKRAKASFKKKNKTSSSKSLKDSKKSPKNESRIGTRKIGSKKVKFKAIRYWKPWQKIVAGIGVVGIFLVLLGLLFTIAFFAWVSKDLPDPDKLIERSRPESSKIYDRTGQILLYEVAGDVKRTSINIEDIPDYVKQATIAIEDKDFYKHKGVSFYHIMTAFFRRIALGHQLRGASTLTQQLVKNAIVGSQRTISRKFKEGILSMQLERKFEKDQILQMYFNEIPYGSNYYGIEAAAQGYFEKSSKDLTLAEAAILAAIPQRPTYFRPMGPNHEKLIERQHIVLDYMVEQDYISEDEAKIAKEEKLNFSEITQAIKAPHFVFYVIEELERKYGEKLVREGGLKVTTTLDWEKQQIAEQKINEGMDKIKKYGGSNAALVAIDPKTGQILCMVGSKDFFNNEEDGQVNVATSYRQPGSSFKPYVMAAAFEKGYTPNTILYDIETDFVRSGEVYHPRNYDYVQSGPITIRESIQWSKNVSNVKLLYLVGVERALKFGERIGLQYSTDKPIWLSLVLGGREIRLVDHVAGYALFANEGIKQEKTPILRIEDKSGQVLEELQEKDGERVLDLEVARNVNNVLSDNATRSRAWGATKLALSRGRPVGAKTGTTQSFRDAWTVGYTPSLAVGVWAGNNDNTGMNRGAAGLVIAAPIWNAFMQEILKGSEIEYFNKPKPIHTGKAVLDGQKENAVTLKINKYSGKIAVGECPDDLVEEKVYREVHSILHYVYKNKPRGSVPDEPEKDPMYKYFEAAIARWAEAQGIITQNPPTEEEDCAKYLEENRPEVFFEVPESGQEITTLPIKASVNAKSPNGILKVEIYVDDELYQTLFTPPYSLNIEKDLTKGFHEIKAAVYDKAGVSVSESVKINVRADLSSEEEEEDVLINLKISNTSLSQIDFPVSLQATTSGATFKSATFYYKKKGSNTIFEIGIDASSSKGKFVIDWLYPGDSGMYKVFVQGETKGGETYQSEEIEVEISE